MLKFKCEECGNSKGLIYRDSEGDLVTECLACEYIEVVGETIEGDGKFFLFENENQSEIKVTCYGEETTYSTKEEAENNFKGLLKRVDGASSESKRYNHILQQIEEGNLICTDEGY